MWSSTARVVLKRCITEAKWNYKRKTEDCFIQHIKNFMGSNPTVSSSHICIWVKDFLPNSIFTLSTGSAQGCVLSPLLYSQYTYMHTYNCT